MSNATSSSNFSLSRHAALPSRLPRFGIFQSLIWIAVVWFIVEAFKGTGISLPEFISGFPAMGRILGEMFPPSTARLGAVGSALFVTFQMAVAGTILGIIASVPLACCASRTQTPHRSLYLFTRTLVSLFRTVPDLIWALFFVATVGLGPFAGTLAIMIDTIGFCGRFFAEGIEEIDQGPVDALKAIGASKLDTLFCAVFPAAMPSFINSSLFALEKSVRASVILGLVGAGGVGVELKVSMDMFRYAEAATIILSIFVLVVIVEQTSSLLRRRILQ